MTATKLARRPFLYPKEGKMESTTLRLSDGHKTKLEALAKRDKTSKGGWLRAQIDAAKL